MTSRRIKLLMGIFEMASEFADVRFDQADAFNIATGCNAISNRLLKCCSNCSTRWPSAKKPWSGRMSEIDSSMRFEISAKRASSQT